MRAKAQRIYQNPFIVALLLSIFLVHLPLAYFLFNFSDDPIRSAVQNPVVTVNLKPMSPGRLPTADIAKPKDQRAPDKPSAQALYNSRVKQETTAPRTGKAPAPKGTSLQQQSTSNSWPMPQRQQPENAVTTKNTPKTKEPAKRESASPDRLAMPNPSSSPQSLQDELKALRQNKKNRETQDLKKFASRSAPPPMAPPTSLGLPNGGFSDDFLPSYKVGSRTYVNALANPQIGYYVELKRKFKMTWNPVPALRNELDKITKGKVTTVWGVSVDKGGKMSGLVLIRGSGLPGYDAEARRTISASAPFSSPPDFLMSPDGQLHMAWTFVVYL